MTLQDFLSAHDRPGAVTLLEGKRSVPPADVASLRALGRLLAARAQHMRFRSGNATGHVYDGRTCKVDYAMSKTEICSELSQPAAAPNPIRIERVDDG